ncbi:MAG: GNAT family N-acetyltransferase [Flavobacteriaceae bacterium]|nr:GNAT family N-acetyltransferase [Flavobacteriaceae bacterium]
MTNKIEIRPIKKEDNTVLAKVIRDVLTEFGANIKGTAFYDTETDSMFEAYQKEKSVYYVALVNGKIVGGGGISPIKNDKNDTCELVKMYLSTEARGLHIGKSIIIKCLAFAKNVAYKNCYLESFPSMTRAIAFYKKNGFKTLDKPISQSCHYSCSVWMLKSL